jgi:hypothetical protein
MKNDRKLLMISLNNREERKRLIKSSTQVSHDNDIPQPPLKGNLQTLLKVIGLLAGVVNKLSSRKTPLCLWSI